MSGASNSLVKKESQAERDVAAWNKWNEAGVEVTVTKDDGSVVDSVTRSQAYVTDAGQAVVFVRGISGCYLLNRVHRKPGQP